MLHLTVTQISKATMLTKTVDFIQQLEKEKQEMKREMDELKTEIDAINNAIVLVAPSVAVLALSSQSFRCNAIHSC